MTKITDLTFGYKLIKIDLIKSIKWEAKFQDIGIETTLKPIKYNYNVKEVPTILRFRKSGTAHSLSIYGNLKYLIMAIKIFFKL